MVVLVTGGLGYIGSHTIIELVNNKYDVIVVDNLYNSSLDIIDRIYDICGYRVKYYNIDILDKDKLEVVFKDNNIDAIIHFAGYKAVGESVELPINYYMNNISGSLNLYDLMIKYKVNKIVFSSSATVYGDPISSPICEDFNLSTTNPYGYSKLVNENILKDIERVNDFNVIILRYFNPIGAHSSGLIGERPNGIPNNLLPYIAQVADGTREFLSVYGNDYNTIDGSGVRDYIHVVDLAIGHIKALEYLDKFKGYDVFNLGTSKGYSVLEIVKAFESVNDIKINYKIVDRRKGDIAICFANTDKAYKLLGFSCKYDINDMCRDAWNFQKKLKN